MKKFNWNEFFASHGIAADVAAARPYLRFECGDVQTVLAQYEEYNEKRFGVLLPLTKDELRAVEKERAHLQTVVKQSGGLVICRHSLGGADIGGFVAPRHGRPSGRCFTVGEDVGGARMIPFNPAVAAELRPDKPVKLRGPVWHFHGSTMEGFPLHPKTGKPWPQYPKTGNWLPPAAVHEPALMREHIARSKSADDHRGVNSEEVHSHQRYVKYVFLPSTKMPKDERKPREPRKIVPGTEHAKRVDIHPMAFWSTEPGRSKLSDVDRVYFGIEGCIKADAMLTAVLRTGENATVASVAAVGFWDTETASPGAEAPTRDLAIIVETLLDRDELPQIVIVPDADWFGNPNVLNQALLCRSLFHRWGYDVCIAAAPIWAGLQPCSCEPVGRTTNGFTCANCAGYFKGVDDYLAAGGQLENLIVLHREAPALEHLLDLQHMRDPRRRRSCARMLTALAEHADNDGVWTGSIPKLARVCGFAPRTAHRVITDYLVGDNIISVDRPTTLKRPQWVRGQGYINEFDWEDRPKFQLPQHLRAEPFRFYRLKNWHNSEEEAMDKLIFQLFNDYHALRNDVQAQRLAIEELERRLPPKDHRAELIRLVIPTAQAA